MNRYLLGGLGLLLAAFSLATGAAEVEIAGVQCHHSSCKVLIKPVQGAKDYRIYDIKNPLDQKYAGLIHLIADAGCNGNRAYDLTNSSCYRQLATNADGSLKFPYVAEGGYGNGGASKGPTGYDGPSHVLDFNGVGDGNPHTLVVEAVDALGPAPKYNLYKETNIKAFEPLFQMAPMPGMPVMLGSNKGKNDDGVTVTNGQGPYTNQPKVIATSRQFTVQADRSQTPIISGAQQVFLDTFEDGSPLVQLPGDCENFLNDRGDWGGRDWTLNAGTAKEWRIQARQIDCARTVPFVMSNHFMEVLADRESTIYGSHAMTPERSFQLNGGILHMSQMVDDVQSGGRWMNFEVAPASDPLVHWNHQDKSLNSKNQWLFMETFRDDAHFLISDGPASGPEVPGAFAEPWGASRAQLFDPITLSPNGFGFDNKRRWDFFLSATWAAFFIEGRLVAQGPVPADKGAWLSGQLKVYFTDYLYHSESGQKQMKTNKVNNPIGDCNIPMFAPWFNDADIGTKPGEPITTVIDGVRIPASSYIGVPTLCQTVTPPGFGFPRTNEWHRDNMSVSVIPASLTGAKDFSSLSALVQPPKVVPPNFGTPAPSPVNCVVSAWGLDTMVRETVNADGSKTQVWQHTRTIDTPPSNGGAACPALVETWTVVVPPPVVQYEVPHINAYGLTASGVRSSVVADKVPSGTKCPGKQLGTTSFRSVKGQKNVAGVVIARDLYAACAVAK